MGIAPSPSMAPSFVVPEPGLGPGLWLGQHVFVGERGACGYRPEPFDGPFLHRKLEGDMVCRKREEEGR